MKNKIFRIPKFQKSSRLRNQAIEEAMNIEDTTETDGVLEVVYNKNKIIFEQLTACVRRLNIPMPKFCGEGEDFRARTNTNNEIRYTCDGRGCAVSGETIARDSRKA